SSAEAEKITAFAGGNHPSRRPSHRDFSLHLAGGIHTSRRMAGRNPQQSGSGFVFARGDDKRVKWRFRPRAHERYAVPHPGACAKISVERSASNSLEEKMLARKKKRIFPAYPE